MNTKPEAQSSNFQASLIRDTYRGRTHTVKIEIPEGCKEILVGSPHDIPALRCPLEKVCNTNKGDCTYRKS